MVQSVVVLECIVLTNAMYIPSFVLVSYSYLVLNDLYACIMCVPTDDCKATFKEYTATADDVGSY